MRLKPCVMKYLVPAFKEHDIELTFCEPGYYRFESTDGTICITLDVSPMPPPTLREQCLAITELSGGKNMAVISYAYNVSSGQLLVQMVSKDSEILSRSDVSIAAYTLDGSQQWEQKRTNSISVASFHDNWCYIDGANLYLVDDKWDTIKSITLPPENYSINRITDERIFLFESVTDGSSIDWYSVSLDWNGNILDKEVTPAFHNACLLSEESGRYIIENNGNGNLGVYNQSDAGINKQIATIDLSSEKSSFVPTAAVAMDEYNYIFEPWQKRKERLMKQKRIY